MRYGAAAAITFVLLADPAFAQQPAADAATPQQTGSPAEGSADQSPAAQSPAAQSPAPMPTAPVPSPQAPVAPMPSSQQSSPQPPPPPSAEASTPTAAVEPPPAQQPTTPRRSASLTAPEPPVARAGVPAPRHPRRVDKRRAWRRARDEYRAGQRQHLRAFIGPNLVLPIGFIDDFGDYNLVGVGVGGTFGVMRHFNNTLGLKLQLGAQWNKLVLAPDERTLDQDPDRQAEDAGSATDLSFDGLLLIGPFAHFYLAPGITTSYVWLSDEVANVEYTDEMGEFVSTRTVLPADGTVFGGALELGGFFGERDDINLGGRVSVGFGEDVHVAKLQLFITFAFGGGGDAPPERAH